MRISSFSEYTSKSYSGIDSLTYGNPTKDLKALEMKSTSIKDWFINKGVDKLILDSMPLNSSEETAAEIDYLIKRSSNLTKEEISFAKEVEKNLPGVWLEFLAKLGYEVEMTEITNIVGQTDPFLFYIKNRINRPRPFQIANVLGKELYPAIHTDANSAAFPGGHALDSYNLCNHFCRRFLKDTNKIVEFAEKVAETRIYTGLHFPSDHKSAKMISDLMWQNNLIKTR